MEYLRPFHSLRDFKIELPDANIDCDNAVQKFFEFPGLGEVLLLLIARP